MGRLVRHLQRDPSIGLLCPTTNFCGNEARVEPDYTEVSGLPAFAARRAAEYRGRVFDIAVAAMYCVAARRAVLETVGPLDEAYGVGMFEDDDCAVRMRAAGFRVCCAEDAFVHHVGQGAFRKLSPEEYERALEEEPGLLREEVRNRLEEAHAARGRHGGGLEGGGEALRLGVSNARSSLNGWICVIAIAAAAVILSVQLLVPPIVGLANNGDFEKVMAPVGLGLPDRPLRGAALVVGSTRFAVVPPHASRSGALYSEILLTGLAVKFNLWLSPDGDRYFDIRVLARFTSSSCSERWR